MTTEPKPTAAANASASTSPLTVPEPWDLVASAYAIEIQPTFEHYARRALELARVGTGMHVVDVAAGPGTLSLLASRAGATVSALDFAPSMIEQLRAAVDREKLIGIGATVGDGMALPYSDASFDAGFSMFGLMFFPDRGAGFRELARVLKPGAPAVVSSWPTLDKLPVLAAVFETLGELVPNPNRGGPSAMPLTTEEDCIREMSAGGFRDVEFHPITASLPATPTEDMLASFERSSAPVTLMKKRLGPAWPDIRAELLRRLIERFGPEVSSFEMEANLTVGVR